MEAFSGRILRINLTEEQFAVAEIESRIMDDFIGARGVGAKVFYDEVKSGIDPLSAENKIIIMTAPFNGTRTLSSPKFTATAKSPLTGFYGESSTSGGKFAYYLKTNGYAGIILEGEARKPVYLKIEKDKVKFESARDSWGQSVTETDKILKGKEGDSQIAIIGPAGENLVKFACIRVEGRTLGRCGLGAVMGSKKLKAVVVGKGNEEINVCRPDELTALMRKFRKKIRKDDFTGKVRPAYGTTHMTEAMNDYGILPTRNFQRGTFDGVGQLSGRRFVEEFKVKDKTCFRCPIGCEKTTLVRQGEYAGMTGSGPEFETIWAFGPQCGNSSLESIIAANHLCNDFGLDTMSTGNIIGHMMECFEKGIVKEKDMGMTLSWGDHTKIVKLVKQIAHRDGIGDLLAEGLRQVGRELKTEEFAIQVKGMGLAAYDPRGVFGMALAYATASRGGCHLRVFTPRQEFANYDPYSFEGKAALVKKGQDIRSTMEAVGLCYTASVALDNHLLAQMVNAVAGTELKEEDLFKIGERIYNLERLLMNREGIDRRDDTLPERFFREALPDGPGKGKRIDKKEFESALDEYYKLRGWDTDGRPTEKKLRELEL